MVGFVEEFLFSFSIFDQTRGKICILFLPLPFISVDCWVALTILQNQSDLGAAKTTNDKVRFPAVCLSGTMVSTGKFAFALFLFYPNQCILLDETPLGGLLANLVDLSRLLDFFFDWSMFHNEVLWLSEPIKLSFTSCLTWYTWKNLVKKPLRIYLMVWLRLSW